MDIDFDTIKPERLSRIHKLDDFYCGDKDIDDFLKNDALNWQEQKIATTTLFVYNEEIIGFFSASSDAIKLKLNEKGNICSITEYPAIKIGRLAVCEKFQRKGVGQYLLKWAIGYVLKHSENVATRFVTVDSYPHKVEWYEKFSFKRNEHEKYIKTHHVSMRYDLYNPVNKNENNN